MTVYEGILNVRIHLCLLGGRGSDTGHNSFPLYGFYPAYALREKTTLVAQAASHPVLDSQAEPSPLCEEVSLPELTFPEMPS